MKTKSRNCIMTTYQKNSLFLINQGDDIEEIRIPRNVTGQAKGYAYVVFKSRVTAPEFLNDNL
jgi:RNA recognition motif.